MSEDVESLTFDQDTKKELLLRLRGNIDKLMMAVDGSNEYDLEDMSEAVHEVILSLQDTYLKIRDLKETVE